MSLTCVNVPKEHLGGFPTFGLAARPKRIDVHGLKLHEKVPPISLAVFVRELAFHAWPMLENSVRAAMFSDFSHQLAWLDCTFRRNVSVIVRLAVPTFTVLVFARQSAVLADH